MKEINALIIEDEKPARELLKAYLDDYAHIVVRGEYDNGFDGLKAVNELRPDVIFLDVQMPKLTGFEMLEVMDHHPAIVFTTAYDQYAIAAFEQNAIDYLLKPFSKARFAVAIDRLRLQLQSDRPENGIEKIRKHLEAGDEKLHRVVIKKAGKIHVISTSDILFLEAQDDFVMIHTHEGRYLKQQTMKYFEGHLDKEQFVRVHRSYIARIGSIERIEPYEKSNYILILKDGSKVPVSRNGMQVLKARLDF